MNKILEIARQRERDMQLQMASGRQQLLSHQQRLKQMEQYLVEYQANLTQQAMQGMSAQRWQHLQAFINNIKQLIGQQQKTCHQYENHCQHAKQQWLTVHNRVEALSKVQQKFKTQEDRQQVKREQFETDEFNNNRRRGKDNH